MINTIQLKKPDYTPAQDIKWAEMVDSSGEKINMWAAPLKNGLDNTKTGNFDSMNTMNTTKLQQIDIMARIEIFQEDGYFCATSPDIPGLYTQADTLQSLNDNIQEVINLLLNSGSLNVRLSF